MVDLAQLQAKASCLSILYYVLGGLSIFHFVLAFIFTFLFAVVFIWEPVLYIFLAVKTKQLGMNPTLDTNRICLALAILLFILNALFALVILIGSIVGKVYAGLVGSIIYGLAAGVVVLSMRLYVQFKNVLSNELEYPLAQPGNVIQEGQPVDLPQPRFQAPP